MSIEHLSEGLTFDDVLLVPNRSDVLPKDVDLSTSFTRRIKLNIPIVSSAMDTVTESAMAIAMAREGGMGIVHRAMSPEAQAIEIEKVKKSESGMIVAPVTVAPDAPISDALDLMRQSGKEVFLTDCGEVVAEHRQLQSAFACQRAPSAR